jgi:GntR family transcriptional regulator, transcriptional repressor for pyruvate dehydrogenase complex
MDVGFVPVVRQTISEQIRLQLVERIGSGELAPGEPVPSERALSERFGVARTSIREALQGLISLGLVERKGNRIHVVERLPLVTVPGTTGAADARKDYVRQLFETRRVLELPIFELAASRATPGQREEIRAIAALFHADMAIDEFRRLDRVFHTTIATACGNPLLVELYGKVLNSLFHSGEFESLLFDEANRDGVANIVGQSVKDHATIARAVLSGDAVATLDASERHLDNVEQRMVNELV